MEKSKYTGYPNSAYVERIAAVMREAEAQAAADPEEARKDASVFLEKIGLLKDGKVQERIVHWHWLRHNETAG